MKTQQQLASKKDSIFLAVIIEIAGLIFLFTTSYISAYLRYVLILFLFFSFIVAVIGYERKIGFARAFFTSLLLSPLIGLIITLSSSKIKDEEYKEKMLEIAENKSVSLSVADQLHKLNELRKEGVLTDEEFDMQKQKLLNP